MFRVLMFSFFGGCIDTPELVATNPDPVGITSETIQEVESALNAAYLLWESEEYDQAFIALESLNHDGMKNIWPILRAEDPEATLHLEVQFGKVLWFTERKRSITKDEGARTLKSTLLRELNDVRIATPQTEVPDLGSEQ